MRVASVLISVALLIVASAALWGQIPPDWMQRVTLFIAATLMSAKVTEENAKATR